jgi:hypothetical protein
VLFLMAAFSPISGAVFRPGVTAEEQIEAVEASPGAWRISSLLFGAGSIVAVVGLFLFANLVSTNGARPLVEFVAYSASVAAAIGAAFWVIVVYYRVTDTPERIFQGGSVDGNWLFPAYTVLTQLALLGIGYVLLQAGYPNWLGWGMIALVSLTVIAMVIFRDMPPFVHYVWMLVMGITLLVTSTPRAVAAATASFFAVS